MAPLCVWRGQRGGRAWSPHRTGRTAVRPHLTFEDRHRAASYGHLRRDLARRCARHVGASIGAPPGIALLMADRSPTSAGAVGCAPTGVRRSTSDASPAAGARTDAAWRPFSCYSVRCQCLVPASAAATTTTVAAATAAASASAAVATAAALGRALLEAVAAVHRLITARLERYFRLLAAVRALRRVHLARARRVTASSTATVTASSAARIATGRFAGAPAIRAPLRLVGEASARVKLLIFRGECKFSPAVHAR